MAIRDRVDSATDKLKGKGNQIAGEARGDDSQRAKGHMQESKGHLKDAGTDVKESFRS